MVGKVPASRRVRRTSEEVRSVILAAATAEFAEYGYDGATTRRIARSAGVAEPMIYRAFATKKGLYDAAVRAPLQTFTRDFTERRWQHEQSAELVLEEFARDLYMMVRANRLVFSALSGQEMGAAAADAPLDEIQGVSEAIKQRFGLQWNTKVAARAAVTMIVGMALLEDVFFSDDETSSDEIIREIANMLIGAAGLHRPPS